MNNNIEQKDIKYVNKNFTDFKQALKNYAETYFPLTYNDFSPSDPGTMFMEMAAYVGDVLSLYQDAQIQEVFAEYAKEKENLMSLAYTLGYRPKVTTAAIVDLDFYQLLPAKVSGSTTVPDWDYSLILNENAIVKSSVDSTISFITQDKVDFSFSSSLSPLEISVYQINSISNLPEYYLLKKKTQAISGQIKTVEIGVGSPERFPKFTINDTNIVKVLSITDSDGNEYTEVPYLAQETVFEEAQNIEQTTLSSRFANNRDTVPYLLKMKKVPRRFVTRFRSDDTMEIEFGSGLSNSFSTRNATLPSLDAEVIIPNPDNIGLGIPLGVDKLDQSFDPSNFLYTGTYGVAPYNTTLTVKYIVGGGIEANVPANDLTNIDQLDITLRNNNLNPQLLLQIQSSVSANNEFAATGGEDGDTVDELRLNTIASFPTQRRAVTKEDYIIRALSMPARYGALSKAYIIQDKATGKNFNSGFDNDDDTAIDNDPLALSLYVLGFDNDKRLTTPNLALKQNLETYLEQYRMLGDQIQIKNASYINLTCDFDIIVLPNFNSQEVLSQCLSELKDFFNIDRWQINQPVLITEVINLISRVKGVQSVVKVEFDNISGESDGYSRYGYDVKAATRNNVIYPSLDPSIFEVRYPDTDIRGRVVQY